MLNRNIDSLQFKKLFLPYDVYERHRVVGGIIRKGETVVDIGGELNHLSLFCKPSKLVVANLTGGDVIIKKNKIPFKKNSFDVVTSIDVLEHIPKNERKYFMQKLLVITKKKLIVSFPIGTEKHLLYESRIQKFLEAKGINVQYLKEHIKYGLPTNDEIENYRGDFKAKVFYSGNLNINNILFRIFIFDPQIKYVRKFIYFTKLVFNLLTNPALYHFLTYKDYSDLVNRAYVVIQKV